MHACPMKYNMMPLILDLVTLDLVTMDLVIMDLVVLDLVIMDLVVLDLVIMDLVTILDLVILDSPTCICKWAHRTVTILSPCCHHTATAPACSGERCSQRTSPHPPPTLEPAQVSVEAGGPGRVVVVAQVDHVCQGGGGQEDECDDLVPVSVQVGAEGQVGRVRVQVGAGVKRVWCGQGGCRWATQGGRRAGVLLLSRVVAAGWHSIKCKTSSRFPASSPPARSPSTPRCLPAVLHVRMPTCPPCKPRHCPTLPASPGTAPPSSLNAHTSCCTCRPPSC